MFPSYENQSTDLQRKCGANKLTGFYMMGTLGINELNKINRNYYINILPEVFPSQPAITC